MATLSDVNRECCVCVDALSDGVCRSTSICSSPLHRWFSIPDSKPTMMPYSSPASSSLHLRHQQPQHHQQPSSSWLSSIVDHYPSPFSAHHQHHDHEACRCHDHSVSGPPLPPSSHNFELDGQLWTQQLSPRRHDVNESIARKTHQQTAAKHQGSPDTRRNTSKLSGNTPGIIIILYYTCILYITYYYNMLCSIQFNTIFKKVKTVLSS